MTTADRRSIIPIGWNRYGPLAGRLKRAIDVIVSLGLLLALSPILLAIAATIRLTSPGPALFRQTRAGFAEEPFTIWKFRTMRTDNDETEHREYVKAMLRGEIGVDSGGVDGTGTFKLVDDPRVTSIGAWLRRTSLDELPQLVNVLRGDMSLVGPRPSLYYEVEEYQPHHRLRAASIPGMTGLWQIEGRSDLHISEALDLDIEYVTTCSVGRDLAILAKTAKVLRTNAA